MVFPLTPYRLNSLGKFGYVLLVVSTRNRFKKTETSGLSNYVGPWFLLLKTFNQIKLLNVHLFVSHFSCIVDSSGHSNRLYLTCTCTTPTPSTNLSSLHNTKNFRFSFDNLYYIRHRPSVTSKRFYLSIPLLWSTLTFSVTSPHRILLHDVTSYHQFSCQYSLPDDQSWNGRHTDPFITFGVTENNIIPSLFLSLMKYPKNISNLLN